MGKVIVVIGPTCSGKSGLAINIAKKSNSEVISADSRQVYKHLNIGTAKPSIKELETVKHHLIDYLEPNVLFNAGMFVEESEKIIIRLTEENKIPVVVGGTGLYIKSLINGIINSVDSDEEIRKNLSEKRKKFGNEFLYNELKKVDNISVSNMLPQNWKRVMRALEVFYISGKPIWQHFEEQKKNVDHKYYQFGLEWDRAKLYQRIEKRVDDMIDAGLIDEVKSILELGYSKETNALNTVGYKEIIQYLENEISFDRAVDLIKRNTRRYAKRQMTWFNKDKRIIWYPIHQQSDLISVCDKIIKTCRK